MKLVDHKAITGAVAANQSVGALDEDELTRMEGTVAVLFESILQSLRIDTHSDHNTQRTAERWAKMMVRETCIGRFSACPDVTDFPNVAQLDQVYAVGPLAIRSLCSHHFMPVRGDAWIGVLPGDRVLGLSKFARLAQWVFARPQIQEEATTQLADLLEGMIKPKGLAVVVRAEHLCMTHRGVEEHSTQMTTSVLRGAFLSSGPARAEFMTMIQGMRF